MGFLERIRFSKPVRWLLRNVFFSGEDWESLGTGFLIAVLSAGLLRLTFPPLGWSWLVWIVFAPLIVVLHNSTVKQGAWMGLLFGVVYFYLNLMWLNNLREYNPFAPVGVVGLTVACALFTAFFGGLTAWIFHARAWWRFLFVPALWTAIEAARATTEMGFPWLYLGHTQVSHVTLIQIVSLTGVSGLTFLIVLVNVAVANTYRLYFNQISRPRYVIPQWLFGGLLLALALIYGRAQLAAHPPSDPDRAEAFRVALIQPGIPQWRKLASYLDPDETRRAELQMQALIGVQEQIRTSVQGLRDADRPLPDLFVLPESTVTEPRFNLYPVLLETMHEQAVFAGAPVLFGANRYAPPETASRGTDAWIYDGDVYNSVYLADPAEGIDLQRVYDKMHLVPFGEYASWFDAIPGFTEYILGIGNFTPGQKPVVFDIKGRRFGTLVCFESCFPYLFRKYVREGVDAVAVLTNDAWYGTSSGPARHYTQSIFRAVEARRPVVRAANTGISAIIDPWGREVVRLDLADGTPRQTSAALPEEQPVPERTLYMRLGEWFAWLCFAYVVMCVIFRTKMHLRGELRTTTDPA